MNRVKRVSFVVRVAQDREGQVSGIIERVVTGEPPSSFPTFHVPQQEDQ